MKSKIIDSTAFKKIKNKLVNKKIVLCHGVFDVLHYGHIKYFNSAKSNGDILIVSITADKYVKKGFNRPYFSEQIRAKTLSSLSIVNYVIINNFENAKPIIQLIKPDLYVKGPDYKNLVKTDKNLLVEINTTKKNGGKIIFTEDESFSSSNIINSTFDNLNNEQKNFLRKFKNKFSIRDINNLINKLAKLKVLVVGEVIIDEYIFSDTVGKSGKEPILINKKINSEKYAGGSISIANHAASFTKEVKVLSYIGQKSEDLKFIKSNLQKNVKFEYVNKINSRTILKTRIVDNYTKNKIIGVYDLNEENLSDGDEKKFINKIDKNINNYDLVIVIDYGHGLLTKNVIKNLKKKSKFLAVNAQLNSLNISSHSFSKYNKSDYIALHEGELRNEFRDQEINLDNLIKKFKKVRNIKNLVVTRGKKGAYGNLLNKKMICPAFSDKVIDRIGAGDTFLSISSLLLYLKAPIEIILLLSNLSASQTISNMGTNKPVSKNVLIKSLEYLIK